MSYPRTHNEGVLKGTKDKRYRVELEYTGHASGKPRHVLRFCDKYIGDFSSLPAATLRAIGHHAELMGEPVFTNIEPPKGWDSVEGGTVQDQGEGQNK